MRATRPRRHRRRCRRRGGRDGRSAGASSVQLSGNQRRVIHDATKQHRDLDVALSDGYVPVGEGAER